MKQLLQDLRRDFPKITFVKGQAFSWSPATRTITYAPELSNKTSSSAPWSLLHELGHALLDHESYETDLELVGLESKAWDKAQAIGSQYGYKIDDDYVQDCMDTYRDWLHQRSACPTCNNRSLQQDKHTYQCFNCRETWTVSSSRFCRPYRRKTNKNKTSPPESKVMFV